MRVAARRAWTTASPVPGAATRPSSGRALQNESDIHRLFLLTSHANARADDAGAIARAAMDATHVERTRAVARALVADVGRMARALRGRGAKARDAGRRATTEAYGHHCYLDASTIGATAGTGVFVRGNVGAGRVVATYPGLTYVGSAVRYMKGYPRVGVNNEYLMARSDGCVIDGKPWGRGSDEGDGFGDWPGSPVKLTEEEEREADGGSFFTRLLRPRLPRERRERLLAECMSLERDNPYAYAHFANHPPEGTSPNVIVATVDVPSDPDTRRYVPNVNIEPDDGDKSSESVWSIIRDGERTIGERVRDVSASLFGEDADKPKAKSTEPTSGDGSIRTLVLVATRDIEDGEEIFLNYRLSTHVTPPSWYTRVDPEEDDRRWA